LEVGETTKEVFGAYLGALGILTEAFVPGYRDRVWERANQAPRGVDAEVLASLARDRRLATSVRAMALREMGASEVSDLAEEMLRWMVSDDSEMRWEAMRRVSELPGEVVAAQLWSVATSESLGPETRADALFFAATRSEFDSSGEKIATLLRDPSEAVAIEAARALRDRTVSDDARGRVAAIRVATRGEDLAPALAEALELVSHAEDDAAARARPKSDAEWLESARAGGDPRRGRRVFWSRRAQCSNCHGMHSRDTRLGPDLAGVGASMDRERIIRSILQPSAEFSPQFQAWMVRLKSGDAVVGLQLDHKARGAIELFTTDKRTRRFEGEEIESYAVLPFSLMPEGLEMLMTESEFRDLVAYLAEPNL